MIEDKGIIIVDLDGVVYDWVDTIARWLHNNDVITDPRMKASSFELWEDWNVPKGEFMRWWRMAIEREEIYAKGNLIKDARSSLWKLNDAGWNIHICTTRLTKFGLHDSIVINTAKWLRENNIPYRELSFTSHKRSIGANAIVDDNLENLNPEVHDQCFLFPRNHNKKVEVDDRIIRLNERDPWHNLLELLI